MLHRNAAQAAEDGPPVEQRSADLVRCPPMEPGADPKHCLHNFASPLLRAACS